MKKILLISILILAVATVSFARKFVASGMTYSTLGNYKVELSDNQFSVNGETLKTFVISYANSPMEVTVAVQKTKTEKRYLVLSGALSVQYVCHGSYFGVELLDKAYEKQGYRTSPTALSRLEYFHQKAITTGENCELDHTRLIAAYFPQLLNNSENYITKE